MTTDKAIEVANKMQLSDNPLWVEVKRLSCEYEKRIADLEEDLRNKRLAIRNRNSRITDLQKQIEKMKNWCNCKNYQQCLIELAEQGKGMKPSECCVNCKKWEIKEK